MPDLKTFDWNSLISILLQLAELFKKKEPVKMGSGPCCAEDCCEALLAYLAGAMQAAVALHQHHCHKDECPPDSAPEGYSS